MLLLSPGVPSSILGAATTLHLVLAVLRNHRRQSAGSLSPLALISLSFAALPWILSSPAGVVAGLAVHAAWFVTCERLLAPAAARAVRSSGATAARLEPIAFRGTATAAATRDAAAPEPRVASSAPAPARPAPAPAPTGFVQTPVIAVFEETSDIRTFRLLRPDGFEFEAGQFLAVRIRVDGQDYVRCYSLASSPDVRGYLEISVKRLGVVSNALHAAARPGSLLWVKAPGGAFRYPSGDDRPILLLAGGIGITPLMSMLRHAIATEPTRPVTLVYAGQHEHSFAFREELRQLPRRHPQARVCFVAERTPAPDMHEGRIDEALLRTLVPEVAHSIAFVCGPKPMMDAIKALLTRLDVPAPQIRQEVFDAAVAVAAGLPAAPAAAAPGAAAGATATHAMSCDRSRTSVPVRSGETLLQAAEQAGVAINSICRAGVCGTCRVRVTEGDVRCQSTTLSEQDRREGYVLACVSTVHSDCRVDA